MLIFWKGKKMVEYRNDRNTMEDNDFREDYENSNNYVYRHNESCGCDCCHCKKIFMMLVLLILVFIAGIMVGNCGRCRYADNYYGDNMQFARNNTVSRPKKFHRGAQAIPSTKSPTARKSVQPYPYGQNGGFVMEIDEID